MHRHVHFEQLHPLIAPAFLLMQDWRDGMGMSAVQPASHHLLGHLAPCLHHFVLWGLYPVVSFWRQLYGATCFSHIVVVAEGSMVIGVLSSNLPSSLGQQWPSCLFGRVGLGLTIGLNNYGQLLYFAAGAKGANRFSELCVQIRC